jgi:hypothetical protein
VQRHRPQRSSHLLPLQTAGRLHFLLTRSQPHPRPGPALPLQARPHHLHPLPIGIQRQQTVLGLEITSSQGPKPYPYPHPQGADQSNHQTDPSRSNQGLPNERIAAHLRKRSRGHQGQPQEGLRRLPQEDVTHFNPLTTIIINKSLLVSLRGGSFPCPTSPSGCSACPPTCSRTCTQRSRPSPAAKPSSGRTAPSCQSCTTTRSPAFVEELAFPCGSCG